MKELKLLLRILFTPSMWKQYNPVNKTWDKILRELMDEKAPLEFGMGYCGDTLGGVPVNLNGNWFVFGSSLANHGRPTKNGSPTTQLAQITPPDWSCSRRTKLLLKDYVEKHSMSEWRKMNSKLHKALK
jgi:hypothetical protein